MEYKGYGINRGNRGLYTINPVGRGSLPKVLRGEYTSPNWAQGAINSYLASKEKPNVETESTG